jgi:glycosyltransferase involved in cell wall biosynthesis
VPDPRSRVGWKCVRVLIFHGYLLGGTGSNVYNARLAAALAGLGHDVHLLSQDRHPEEHSFVDAVGDWGDGTLRVSELDREQIEREESAVPAVALGRALHGLPPRASAGCCRSTSPTATRASRRRRSPNAATRRSPAYIDANVAAVREVAALVRPEVALANHLVMGPADPRPWARPVEVPYAVKVHGSALEYTVKPDPERFLGASPARGWRGRARCWWALATRPMSLWEALKGEQTLPARTRLGPPGVDVAHFIPSASPAQAAAGVRALAARLRASDEESRRDSKPGGQQAQADAFARDDGAAARALERLDPESELLVAFVGKLIVSKGVDLLIAAWPLVIERVPRARLVLVGFGAYRDGLEQLLAALAAGDLGRAREIAIAGRGLEDGRADSRPLKHLLAFLDSLRGTERERYLNAASRLGERVVLTGRLDHGELAELLPACEAVVVPSTFPEAFGMVAAEAAACGALPISAGHSGLAEVSEVLAEAVSEPVDGWLSFPVDDGAVGALAARLIAWLQVDPQLRSRTRAGLAATVRERWSWDGVAEGVIAAARGELDGLREP